MQKGLHSSFVYIIFVNIALDFERYSFSVSTYRRTKMIIGDIENGDGLLYTLSNLNFPMSEAQ